MGILVGMPGENFIMAMGRLGLSLAGFAGLISALDHRPAAQSAVVAYRIRGIVLLGFSLTVIAFTTIAVYTLTNADLPLTIRIGSLLLVLPHLDGLRAARPGPAWSSDAQRRATIASLIVLIAIALGNVVVASLGYLQILLLIGLVGPASIFFNQIKESTGRGVPVAEVVSDAAAPAAQATQPD